MGCDIHGYLEQRKPGGKWEEHPVSIRLSRNYELFARLAGVRNYAMVQYVAGARGIPSDACHDTHIANCVFVSDILDSGAVTKARADAWIANGQKWYKEGVYVTNPDYHSHSWCTRLELEGVIKKLITEANSDQAVHDCYRHLAKTMHLTEKLGYECRLVFWFDN